MSDSEWTNTFYPVGHEPQGLHEAVSKLSYLHMYILKDGEHPPQNFAFKADIIAALCMCHTWVQPKDVLIFNENEYMIEFEESIHVGDIQHWLEHITYWLGIQVQGICSVTEVHHLGILHRNNHNSDLTLTALRQTREENKVQNTSEEVVRQFMLTVKEELHGRTESTENLGLQQGLGSLAHFSWSHFTSLQPSSHSLNNLKLMYLELRKTPVKLRFHVINGNLRSYPFRTYTLKMWLGKLSQPIKGNSWRFGVILGTSR